MTDEQTVELRKLSDAATPGPWKADTVERVGENWLIGSIMDCGDAWVDAAEAYSKFIVTTDGLRASRSNGSDARDDAAFIAAAVNYTRAALSAIPPSELLREALEALEPFGKMATALNAAISSDEDVLIEGLGDDPPIITAGHLRRARAIIDALRAQEQKP